MELGFKHYFVIILALLFLLKKVLSNRFTLIDENHHFLNLLFFMAVAVFLGVQFWLDGLYIGLLALFLGGLAFGKYYYDVSSE